MLTDPRPWPGGSLIGSLISHRMVGATEHRAVVQALLDDLIERGLDPAVPRLFIIDARRRPRSFGRHMPIQRC